MMLDRTGRLTGERRIAADRLWRDPAARARFEKDCGISDATPETAEYQGAFVAWADNELGPR